MRLIFTIVILLFISCDSDNNVGPPTFDFIEIGGDITKDISLTANRNYLLIGQTFVKPGVTFKIEAGTTIKALSYDRNGAAPAVIFEPGSRIIADGTKDRPITFTSAMDISKLPQRGLWGGIIIMGKAPINQSGGQAFVEGIAGIPFGGNDPNDNSGILRFVRVWYGGRSIGDGNEINGFTFAGVGRGTIVENCEVAWNLDDGFEFFGGTVNVKYLSAIFCGDDCFDTDWGYQGKGQFLFALLGQDICGRGFEMDNDGENMDAKPRSYPQFCNVTLIGPDGGTPEGDGADEMIRLREGTGGNFRNLVIVNGNGIGLQIKDAPTLALLTQTPPATGESNAIYFSSKNFVYHCSKGSLHKTIVNEISVNELNPMLRSVPQIIISELQSSKIDPRPESNSPVSTTYEDLSEDPFFIKANYSGAFNQDDLWLKGFSWLDEAGTLP